MCSNGKLFCLVAALIACCLAIDGKPIKSGRHARHARHAKAPMAIHHPPAEQHMFDYPLDQVYAGGSTVDSSISGESSMEGDMSAEGSDAADYEADNPEPMGNDNNHRANGGQLPIFGSPNAANPGMEPLLKKASTSSSSVGIAFAVLALLGAAVGVSVYVIKRNRISIPFIKMYN